jgi:hypothetical protein
MQALNAWLIGHDHGLLLQGPDPDSREPVMHGIVINQQPGAKSPVAALGSRDRLDPAGARGRQRHAQTASAAAPGAD